MYKLKSSLRIVGLLVLLFTLVLFLTGCFDVYQEVWIGADPADTTMRATFTMYSEEIFEMLKGAIMADPERGEVSFEVIEPEDPEGETIYRIIQVVPPEEGMIHTFPYNGGTAYEMTLLSQEADTEVDETTREMFEGHTYEVEIHFPNKISEAWWGKVGAEDKLVIEKDAIEDKSFHFASDLLTAMEEEFSYLTVVTKG